MAGSGRNRRNDGGAVSVEAALAATQIAAAALGLEGPAPVEASAVEPTATKVGRGGAEAGPRGPIAGRSGGAEGRSSSAGPRGPAFRLVHAQGAALEVLPVHGGDATFGRLVALE